MTSSDGAANPAARARIAPTFGETGPIYPPSAADKPPAPAAANQPSPQIPRPRIFVSDKSPCADRLGRASALARLAELLAHKDAEGPLSIAVLGGPGAGKSHAIDEIVSRALAASAAARDSRTSPFAPRLFVLKLQAAELASNLAALPAALVARMQMRMAREHPALDARAREETAASASDPHALARAAQETLDAARRALDAERNARDEVESRRARLSEFVLRESSGGQFDSFARAHRSRIETAVRAFGFNAPDALADYRGLVQTFAESGGPLGRALASARALWAYRGQTRRIALAAVAFSVAWGLGWLASDHGWLGAFESAGESARPVAKWLADHLSIFSLGASLATLVGLAALASLLWRAWRFDQPLRRGADLLEADIQARRGDLDHLIAHHAQRVDALTRECETLAVRAAEAEKHAGGPAAFVPRSVAFTTGAEDAALAARAYLAALDRWIAKGVDNAPGRIVVVLDSLDAQAPETALAILSATADTLAKPSFALLTGFDSARLAAIPHARAILARLVETPFALPPANGWSDFVGGLANHLPAPAARPAPTISALDTPLNAPEVALLTALAELAGPAPRDVARLVNHYRLARHDAPDDLAALAFMLALALGGDRDEQDAVARALETGADTAALQPQHASARLARGLAAAAVAQGGPILNPSGRRGATLARQWTL